MTGQGLTMAAWAAKVIGDHSDEHALRGLELFMVDTLTAWPRTDEATATLSALRNDGIVSHEHWLKISSERLRRATELPDCYPGYDGTGRAVQALNGLMTGVHRPDQCYRRQGGCWVHDTTPPEEGNVMYDWPVAWLQGARAVRMCEHGEPHPDMDDVGYLWSVGEDGLADHLSDCDGCCDRGAALIEQGRWRLISDEEVDAIVNAFFAEGLERDDRSPYALQKAVAVQLGIPLDDVRVAMTSWNNRR